MKTEIIDIILEITKNDESNILFLLSASQYESYVDDRKILSEHIREAYINTDFNSWDTTRGMHDQMRYVQNLFEDISKKDRRKVAVIFTKNRNEINELATRIINLDNVEINVYII